MRIRRNILFALRFALVLLVVATTMAVSCPQPDGPEPPTPPVVDTKSAEQKQLEASHIEGLYLKGSCVLPFELATFQHAASVSRKTYRIQSDDQTRYLHVNYKDGIPQLVGDEVECEIHYRLVAGESTMLIVKLVVVASTEEYLWLWNEFQKVGMIVQRLS